MSILEFSDQLKYFFLSIKKTKIFLLVVGSMFGFKFQDSKASVADLICAIVDSGLEHPSEGKIFS